MDRELLLEIGCEELPASWLAPLTKQLAEHLAAKLGAFRLTADADLSKARHQDLEVDDPVPDALLGYLDGSDVAGVAENGGRAVTDLAYRRDRYILTDKRRI